MTDQFDADLAAGRAGFLQPAGRTHGHDAQPALPVHLSRLLHAPREAARSDAWADFLRKYSKLILKVTRRASASHDEAMDRYAFILDQLRQDDFRRLRAFAADGRGKFTTWLVVVARRLCVDHHRQQRGRPQAADDPGGTASLERAARRNLVDLLGADFDLELMEDGRSARPDAAVMDSEQRNALIESLNSLDDADRLLLTLRFEDDLPLARIGPIVGLDSRFQVHRRLKTVLAQLREALLDRGFGHS
jgi:RNA polymerase sigma factor (sigma-70 family)